MSTPEDKKKNKSLIISLAFIIFSLAFFFFMDYFQKQSLLKNGIHADAVVIGRYCEINTDTKDTSTYSMRLKVIADTGKTGSFGSGELLSAYVKKESFVKYEEGKTVKVVYKKEDPDHARLMEELE